VVHSQYHHDGIDLQDCSEAASQTQNEDPGKSLKQIYIYRIEQQLKKGGEGWR
jgi:hypothetical protein